ncbi:WD40 repeat domain-containing protein [Streptomyces sp. NPDC048290]|uniref:WD40 repeat domain-containing protein n=1 Tax=Streptomyces sp. NPDC048290 TaxID=3155811 RepID=UPI00343717AF
MNTEVLLRQALGEQAAEQGPLGSGFADRVLAVRRRRRARALAAGAAATVAAVILGVGVPLLNSGERDVRPSSQTVPRDVEGHPDQSPPRERLSAGRTLLAAYYTSALKEHGDGTAHRERTYSLLDPDTGRYEKDDRWSFVAVAPGARTAAVLERELPANRIGLLDLATGRVERWIKVDRGVGGLAFAPDGQRLVATAYTDHPEMYEVERAPASSSASEAPSSRSGFCIVDLRDGAVRWSEVATGHTLPGARADFTFGRDGTTVSGPVWGAPATLQAFYDLAGRSIVASPGERHLNADVGAKQSPDGTLAAGGRVGGDMGESYSELLDARTGERATKVRGAELLAWVDQRRLIAWEWDKDGRRLVLVTVGSDEVVRLSGAGQPMGRDFAEGWQPVFTTW